MKSRFALVALAFCLIPAFLQATQIQLPQGKGKIETVVENGVEYISLSDLLKSYGGRYEKDSVSQYPVWEINNHRVVFSTNTPMLSVDGKLVSLKATPVEKGARLLVGAEFIELVFPKIGIDVDAPKEKEPPPPPPKKAPLAQAPPAGAIFVEKAVSYDLIRITFRGSFVSLSETKKEGNTIKVRLPGGKITIDKETLGEGMVTEIFSRDEGREIVISLDKGFKSYETVNLKNPERLVLLIKGEGQKPRAEVPSASAGDSFAHIPVSTPAKKRGAVLIVLDPGHGGQDTGALGKEETVEKTLALELSLKIKEALEQQGVDVLLTRNSDVFIPLKERTAIANFNGADLFLSIHFNSSPIKSAKGSESYIMSRDATDLWSKQVSEKENFSSPGEGEGDGLSMILWNLAQNQFIVESASMAGELQESLNSFFGAKDRGVRQAPFAVLEGAKMPAVLLEVAFLSNPSEAKNMKHQDFINGVVNAIVLPIIRFKDRNVPPAAD